MVQEIYYGCCELTYEFEDIKNPIKEYANALWSLVVDVGGSVKLYPTLVESVVMYEAMQKILSWEQCDHGVKSAFALNSRWDYITLSNGKREQAGLILLATGPVVVHIEPIRAKQILHDMRSIFLKSLGYEPKIKEFLVKNDKETKGSCLGQVVPLRTTLEKAARSIVGSASSFFGN